MVRSVTQLTIREIAKREQVTERTAQRYCSAGYQQGKHILLSTVVDRRGKRLVEIADYKAWRVACGFDKPATPEVPAAPSPSGDERPASPKESLEHPAPASSEEAHPRKPKFNPWPMAADPNGVLTNQPAPHSRNWPHPLALKAHGEEIARRMKLELRGDPDAIPEG